MNPWINAGNFVQKLQKHLLKQKLKPSKIFKTRDTLFFSNPTTSDSLENEPKTLILHSRNTNNINTTQNNNKYVNN
jgi:hypothetical protein